MVLQGLSVSSFSSTLHQLILCRQCLLLVAFQRRIIYLPSVPPGTRQESLQEGERTRDRDSSLSGLNWNEVDIESSAPTRLLRRKVKLKGIELSWKEEEGSEKNHSQGKKTERIVLVYLQGASQFLPRLVPIVLKVLERKQATLEPL